MPEPPVVFMGVLGPEPGKMLKDDLPESLLAILVARHLATSHIPVSSCDLAIWDGPRRQRRLDGFTRSANEGHGGKPLANASGSSGARAQPEIELL